jgi:AhpD family alkylhydroperoxidase
MTKIQKTLRNLTIASLALVAAPMALADDMANSPDAVYADIQATFGSVPSFMKAVPKAALAGLWTQTKQLEFSDKTALSPKTKALIGLAVASQIPCDYCIWSDAATAKQMGATDEEIGEAVAMAGLTRNWSTMFYGLQVDLAQFKKELGGQ